MNRRGFLGTTLLGGGTALAATSCGPMYYYVHQGVPSPLLGARHISLEPIHFERMLVGNMPEPDYLANKTPQQVESFQNDKQEFANRFAAYMSEHSPLAILLGPPPDAMTVTLRPFVLQYEPGFFAYLVNRDTRVDMLVQLVRLDGVVLEDIRTMVRVPASMYQAASGTRMRTAGEQLGRIVGTYLEHRALGQAFRPEGVPRRG